MATLSQMASSPSPSAYLPKILGKVAMACVLSVVLLHLSPAPTAAPQVTPEIVAATEMPVKGPGLMRHERPLPKAPAAPRPEAWGQLMRKEAPVFEAVGTQARQSSTVFIVAPLAAVALIGLALQARGTLAHMASSTSPSAFFPKFLAAVVVACILSLAVLHVSPTPEAKGQLIRSEGLGPLVESQAQQSSTVFLILLAIVALIAFCKQGKGTLAQMSSASSPAAYFPTLLTLVLVAGALAAAVLQLSPAAGAQEQLMRKEVLSSQPGQSSSLPLFAALGAMMLIGFARQGQGTLASMASSSSPSSLLPKFFVVVVGACLLTGMVMQFSPSAEGQGPLMRSEAPVQASQAGQSSRIFFLALFGAVALAGFAMQAKETFMQLVNLGDAQKYFNAKAK